MKRYVFYNVEATKGVIISGNDMDEAKSRAHECFYGPFQLRHNKDLVCGQLLERGKNYPFSVPELKIFKKVQFEFMGGVTTSYDTHIYIEPTQKQLDFMDGKELEFVRFFNTDFYWDK